MKLIIIAACLCLSGCATRAELRGLEHRIYAVEDGQGIHECVSTCPRETSEEVKIRDLEMQNAALKEINKYLLTNKLP